MIKFNRSSGPLYISPTNKTFLRPEENKEICITSWVSVTATAEVVLTMYQPCMPVCIGNSATTIASLIGKHTCTRLYYD